MQNMIETIDLVFNYKADEGKEDTTALNKISINIKKGEFVAIIGHNGSGKSTLAKHVNALLLPSSGKMYVKNMDTSDENNLWNIRQSAGMVFQNPDNQIVATIVEEDVAFGPENLGIPPKEIRIRVDDSLKAVKMENFKNHGPHLLSGGQKQRVAIAGVLAMKPECIVLDEPTAMLDPSGRKEVIETIERLNRDEGITIVLITHYMEEAVGADRVIVMENGEIVLSGVPKEVFKRVEELKRIGLDVPQMTELAYELRKEGFKIAADTLTIDEMVVQLCQ